VLQQLLATSPRPVYNSFLVVRRRGRCRVWQLDANTCIIATTDFFMPRSTILRLRRIAATNAISDVYAMGGKPIMALAILGMPVDKIQTDMVREILKGGASVCASVGIPVAVDTRLTVQSPCTAWP